MSSQAEKGESGDLLIVGASSADIGCYRCVVRGISGTVSAEACLSVRIRPRFTALPTDNLVTVNAGEDAIITCRATGNPAPTYQWSKLREELPMSSTVDSEGNLKLIRVIKKDAGVYRCTASNRVDTISQDIKLEVIGTFYIYVYYSGLYVCCTCTLHYFKFVLAPLPVKANFFRSCLAWLTANRHFTQEPILRVVR
jgi:hypothetical protein